MDLTVHCFPNRIKKNPFSKEERVCIEDGITTIRPYRNGKPSSTNKELEAAFAEFQRAITPDELFPDAVEYDINLEGHNRRF